MLENKVIERKQEPYRSWMQANTHDRRMYANRMAMAKIAEMEQWNSTWCTQIPLNAI